MLWDSGGAELQTRTYQKKIIAEMRKFYYQYSSLEKSGNNRLNGFSRVESMPVEKLLKNIQQLVLRLRYMGSIPILT